MSELTHDETALLCVISEYDLSALSAANRRDLERLIAGGYVEETHDDPASPFKVTAMGTEFLAKRASG